MSDQWPTPRGQDSYERRNWKTVKRINEQGGDLTLPSKVIYMERMSRSRSSTCSPDTAASHSPSRLWPTPAVNDMGEGKTPEA